MRDPSRSICTLVVSLILFSVTGAFAQDWPQWRGANRDGKVAGFTAPQSWPKELTQKWKVTVGTGDATPALVGDKLYVFARQGEDEDTLCLDAASGKEVWRNKYATQAVAGPASRHPGPRSSPTVAEGKVVTLGVNGILSCLDAATGKEVWRKDEFPGVVPQFFAAMSPIIDNGTCIAHLGGKDNGAVMAFDLASGNVKWKWAGGPAPAGDGPAYASPVLMTVDGVKQVVAQTEKNTVGLAAADGKLLWHIPTPPQGRFYNSATPIIDGLTVIYTGQGQGTKAVKIEKQNDGFAAKEVWSNTELGTGFNTPVLKDGFLYGLSDRGSFFCLNAQTGQTAWADAATRKDNFGAIVDAGPVIFGLPGDSQLVVFKPSDKEYAEIARFKVAETPTYAHPVISGNRIFIRDQETVALWTIP